MVRLFLGVLLLGAAPSWVFGASEHLDSTEGGKSPRFRPLSLVPPTVGGGSKKKLKCDSTDGNGLSKEEEKRVLRQRDLDVPHVVQEGATCGLAAVKMAMMYHHRQDRRNANPPLYDYDEPLSEKDREPILKYAKRKDLLWEEDGQTTHWGLAEVPEAWDYTTWSRSSAYLGGLGAPTISDLKDEIRKGYPVLVSVRGTNEAGMPCESDDKGGHWIVIESFARYAGVDYMIVNHGHEGAKDVVWPVSMFEAAWKQNWRATVYLHPPY